MPRKRLPHKTLYVPDEAVEIWDDAQTQAATNGVSLSAYVAEALAEHNHRQGGSESPASLAKRLSALLNRKART